MRAAVFNKMAPRGAHPPDAKFLQVPPPTITYCDVTALARVQLSKKSTIKSPSSAPQLQILSKAIHPSDHPKSTTSTKKIHKIPSSNDNAFTQLSAPVSQPNSTSSTTDFHIVPRTKKSNSRYFKFSPKNYYHNSKFTDKTESSKQSVFTKFSEFIEEEEESPTMSDTSPNTANQVSPEKDVPMNEVSDCNPMSPEEERALMEEFDTATQEPPPKQAKTGSTPTVDLTATSNNPPPHLQALEKRLQHLIHLQLFPMERMSACLLRPSRLLTAPPTIFAKHHLSLNKTLATTLSPSPVLRNRSSHAVSNYLLRDIPAICLI